MGLNVLRVLSQAEAVADGLKNEPPSTATIETLDRAYCAGPISTALMKSSSLDSANAR